MIALLLTVATARAEDRDVGAGVTFGLETQVGDPYVKRRGLRGGVLLTPTPALEIGASAAYYPILGTGGSEDPEWTDLAGVVYDAGISPAISKLQLQAQATLRVLLVEAPITDDWSASAGVLAGVAMFRTEDDLVSIYKESVDSAEATRSETYPGYVAGASFDVRRGGLGARLRLERGGYVEVLNERWVRARVPRAIGLEAMWSY